MIKIVFIKITTSYTSSWVIPLNFTTNNLISITSIMPLTVRLKFTSTYLIHLTYPMTPAYIYTSYWSLTLSYTLNYFIYMKYIMNLTSPWNHSWSLLWIFCLLLFWLFFLLGPKFGHFPITSLPFGIFLHLIFTHWIWFFFCIFFCLYTCVIFIWILENNPFNLLPNLLILLCFTIFWLTTSLFIRSKIELTWLDI